MVESQKRDHTGNHWLNKTKQFLDKLGLSYIHRVHNRGERKASDINRLSVVTKKRENEIFEQNLGNTLDSQAEKNEGKLILS